MAAWKKALVEDSMQYFDNCIASHVFDEDVCKKFDVSTVPYLVLIDENGTVLALNPTLSQIEKILDDKKNRHPVTSDITGYLAHSNNTYYKVKNTDVTLLSHFGDSISSARTDAKGKFLFLNVKLNQDFMLKVRVKNGILKNDRLTLFNLQNEVVADARLENDALLFPVPAKVSSHLAVVDSTKLKKHTVEEIDVTKSLEFRNEGNGLTDHDKSMLVSIVHAMQKNSELVMEFYAHTDSKNGAIKSSEITGNQVQTLKKFFVSQGIAANRMIGFGKGQNEPRRNCHGDSDCSEEDHKYNRRVEFWIYKDVTK